MYAVKLIGENPLSVDWGPCVLLVSHSSTLERPQITSPSGLNPSFGGYFAVSSLELP